MQEKKWINYPRLSYSRLSTFVTDGPFSLVHRIEKKSKALTIGSLVDDILFLDKKEFKEKYIISTAIAPTSSLKVLADEVIKLCTEGKLNFKELNIVSVIRRLKLWNNIVKEDTLIKKYNTKNFNKYVLENIRAWEGEKTLITAETYTTAKEQVDILLTDDSVNLNFNNENEDIENLFQYKLSFKYDGIKFLGYIDILQIDHKRKTIQIKDLKTTSLVVSGFFKSFLNYNYYIQGGLYSLGLPTIIKELKLEGYRILPFEFIYSSFLSKSTITYIMTDTWLSASIYGFDKQGRYYKGIKQIIEDIKWHFDNKVFNKSRYLHENKNRVEIPSSFIKVTENRYEGE